MRIKQFDPEACAATRPLPSSAVGDADSHVPSEMVSGRASVRTGAIIRDASPRWIAVASMAAIVPDAGDARRPGLRADVGDRHCLRARDAGCRDARKKEGSDKLRHG